MRGAVTGTDLDRIAQFFRSRGCKAPVTFDVCPLADDSLAALIAQRAWPFAGFEQVLWRSISPEVRPDQGPGVAQGLPLVEIDRSRAEEWATLLARVFSGQDDPPRWQVEIGLRGFDLAGGAAWAVLHEGRMIAAARSFLSGGAAHFSGAAVLPAYRNRGLQLALLRARLEHARSHRCDLAKTDTHPGTTSQRNAHRCGFHVAYTRAQFMMPVV
jgi:GNAT superfamily N-acetyltransferase